MTQPKEVYHSKALVIKQLSANSFQHISYLQTNDFGLVPCNGLVIKDQQEAIIFDTPTNIKSAEVLIRWIKFELGCNIIAIIPTHFHDDCIGGLDAFHKQHIPSFAYKRTFELAKENKLIMPQNSFDETKIFNVGNTTVEARFFGEGHTKDNIIGYFKKEEILFGGCLIKELNATKGYLGDANVLSWSSTVENVKKSFPQVKIIIPGHGQSGDKTLLDYTIQLFKY